MPGNAIFLAIQQHKRARKMPSLRIKSMLFSEKSTLLRKKIMLFSEKSMVFRKNLRSSAKKHHPQKAV